MKAIFILFLAYATLFSHPHIFVDNDIDLTIQDSEIEFKITWTLDDMTSMALIMDYDRDGSGSFDKNEVAALKKDAFDHLVEINYMTFFICNKKEQKIEKVENFNASIKNNKVAYSFSFTSNCIKKGVNTIEIGCADKENYLSLMIKDKNVKSLKPSIKVEEVMVDFMDYGLAVADVLKVRLINE